MGKAGKAALAVEDMRSVQPVAYIRAVGLRPEDCYGFLPIDLHDSTSYFFLYRDDPAYEERRVGLPGAESVRDFGAFEVHPTSSVSHDAQGVEDLPIGGGALGELIQQATQAQQMWSDQGVAGGPNDSEADRIARIDKLKEMGAIDQAEYDRLVSEVRGGDAGPQPGGATAAPAEPGAPDIVCHRLYPGLRMRSSTRQLNHFLPKFAEQVGLQPEDVYGVYPRWTRTSSSAESVATEWDDYWIVYRDRPEYAAGRESWAENMDRKGKWPETEVYPGVAGPGAAAAGGGKLKVEKDRWPRSKLVMRKKGTDLGEALRQKIGKWGFEPEASFGFCPDFDNSAIYFGWRKV